MKIGFRLFGVDVTLIDTDVSEGCFEEESETSDLPPFLDQLELMQQGYCPWCGKVPEEINVMCNSCRAALKEMD